MSQNFFDPKPEELSIVLVTRPVLKQAQQLIAFCEKCNSEDSEYSFDYLLDHVTGCDPSRTEYVLEVPARCPNCRCEVFEKTFVAPYVK